MRGSLSDTIAAISTPLGEGGIGVIRISGAGACNILSSIFLASNNQKSLESHRLYHGFIVNPKTRDKIDEVMAAYMQAPNSYTGEDVAEISGHGGTVVLNNILSQVLSLGGRLAERGEFTKRAFLNGRIDLSQAEAVIDLVRARTSEGAKAAISQLSGALSRDIKDLREQLIKILMRIEASIDFSQDVEELSPIKTQEEIFKIKHHIAKIIGTADTGKILRQGIAAAIVGRSNVGKSSLLNALLRHERAIVTDVPGTTRDVIEETINIHGFPFRIIDMAGIRDSTDQIEQMGIAKAKAHMALAELILLVIDTSENLKQEDIKLLEENKNRKMAVVLNKNDKPSQIHEAEIAKFVGNAPQVRISALLGEGIGDLEDQIISLVINKKVIGEGLGGVINQRHKESLDKALASIDKVLGALESGQPLDLAAIDIKDAIVYLGEVSGETVSEEVINRIFEEFCIGK